METERSEPVAAETTGADNTGNSRASAATTNERAWREAGTADNLSDLRTFRRGPLTISGRAGVTSASSSGGLHARLVGGVVRGAVAAGDRARPAVAGAGQTGRNAAPAAGAAGRPGDRRDGRGQGQGHREQPRAAGGVGGLGPATPARGARGGVEVNWHERVERATENLAGRTSRRGMLGLIGRGTVALAGGGFVAAALDPQRAEARWYTFCGHTYTTKSCPHPYAPYTRIDKAGYPLHPKYGYPVDDNGAPYTSRD